MCIHRILYAGDVNAVAKNLTISIPDQLANEMRNYSEVNWSEICRQAITNYIKDRTGILSIRVQRRNEVVKFVADRRLPALKEEFLRHFCDKWTATPEEVEEILKIAVGAGDLSVGTVNGRTYIIYKSWPHGSDAVELQKDPKLVHEVSLRRLRDRITVIAPL